MTEEEFNKKVEEWHLGAGEGQELHEYLGMTWEEYKSHLVPIPQALLGEFAQIKALADENRKREVALQQEVFDVLKPHIGEPFTEEILRKIADVVRPYWDGEK